MKANYLVLGVLYVLFASFTGKPNVNGWYFIIDNQTDAISESPIVTVSDFEALRMDSMLDNRGSMHYEMIGKVKANKMKTWADATEKAIGKRIGFLYNNEIISSPQVNMRIESGNFSITSFELHNDKDKMLEIYMNLKKEMK